MSKKKSIFGSVSYVMIIMVLSRLLALVSTQVYMSFFGVSSIELNIYSYAITIPNTIFNCFGTALSTVVIPIYAGHIANGNKQRAENFANNIISITTIFTLVLIVLGLAASYVLPKFTTFNEGENYKFAVKALMIMMPVMLFYGLNYIFQGILQSHGKFGWPAFVSVPSSLVVILYVFTLADKFGVTGLLVATFIGLSLQAIILIPPLVASGFKYRPSFALKDNDIVSAFKMTIPVMIGVSAYQLNMFYNVTMIANFDGMVTLLTYVQNIVVYMVLAFIYSVTAVIYPKLTASAAIGDFDDYKQTLNSIINNVLLLLVPISFGFVAVREPLLRLIAGWGKITNSDISVACMLVVMYSIGIIGVGLKEILDRAFYAIKNTKIPAINGFIIMATNIILSLIFIQIIGAYGIPLAYSISSLIGLLLLLYLLKRKIGSFGKNVLINFVKSVLSALVMFFVVYIINLWVGSFLIGEGIIDKILKLFIPAVAGVVVYCIMLVVTRTSLGVSFCDKFFKKVGAKK